MAKEKIVYECTSCGCTRSFTKEPKSAPECCGGVPMQLVK